MSTINTAVQTWTGAVESKMADFAKRQKAQAGELAGIKALLDAGRRTESKADADHRKEFGRYLAEPEPGQQKRVIEAGIEAKVISAADAASGGLAVPRTIAVAVDAVAATYCPWLDPEVLGARPISSGDWRDVYAYGSGINRVGESDTRSATATPTFRSVAPVYSEFYALAGGYSWAFEDVQDIEATLTAEFGRQLGGQLAADIWAGSGSSGQIRGLTAVTPEATADDASPQRTEHALQYVPISGATSPQRILTDDVANLLGEFAEAHLMVPGFCLVMRPSTWRSLLRGEAGSDAPFTMPRNPSLFGLPVKLCAAMPAIGANALPIVAGDFRAAYTLVQRTPLRVLVDNTSVKGQTFWYGSVRYAGTPRNTNAAKVLKFATT